MVRRILLAMPGNERLAAELAALGQGELGALEVRRFPDEESYVRIVSPIMGAEVDIVCTLARPDAQYLALMFAAETARELGARKVHLIAPYLAYMRQDMRFSEGEAVSSRIFARRLSELFDSLVTVDPHLHRRHDLAEIFAIPTRVLHAAPLIGAWIKAHVVRPLVIGPDSEAEQWARDVAAHASAPHLVLRKTRLGDRNVRIELPDLKGVQDLTPVLVDDIAASGGTLIEAARLLDQAGMKRPVCAVVHPIFASDAYQRLAAVTERIVSTDSLAHGSNAMALASLLCGARAGQTC